MGVRHTTTYHCDWCSYSSDSPRLVNAWVVYNHHGGSPRLEWNICDTCSTAARVALDVLIDRRGRV